MRLRSDIWVSAYIRRAGVEGAFAVLRRRGAAEAGAIFVLVDCLDGRVALFQPGPADEAAGERRWLRAHATEWTTREDAEARLARQFAYDPDIWVIELENPRGEFWLELAALPG